MQFDIIDYIINIIKCKTISKFQFDRLRESFCELYKKIIITPLFEILTF